MIAVLEGLGSLDGYCHHSELFFFPQESEYMYPLMLSWPITFLLKNLLLLCAFKCDFDLSSSRFKVVSLHSIVWTV